jgi:threonine dehydratase
LISRIIERGLVKDGRLSRLLVMMPDRPGSLARFSTTVAEQGANIVEIYHNYVFSKAAIGEAEVEVTVESRGRSHVEELLQFLRSQGWEVKEQLP